MVRPGTGAALASAQGAGMGESRSRGRRPLLSWGDRIDASWTCNKQSFPERALPSPIGRFPVDESPYGVLGMAGNMCDWTSDIYEDEGPPVSGSRSCPSKTSDTPEHFRTIRGSSWVTSTSYFRLAQRFSWRASFGKGDVSFRLVRSL